MDALNMVVMLLVGREERRTDGETKNTAINYALEYMIIL